MKSRKHKIEVSARSTEHGFQTLARVYTHNGKLAAECRSERMARKVAQALDMLDNQRRRYGVDLK